MKYKTVSSLTKYFFLVLEDISPSCWATDTPVLAFLVVSPLGFKARVTQYL